MASRSSIACGQRDCNKHKAGHVAGIGGGGRAVCHPRCSRGQAAGLQRFLACATCCVQFTLGRARYRRRKGSVGPNPSRQHLLQLLPPPRTPIRAKRSRTPVPAPADGVEGCERGTCQAPGVARERRHQAGVCVPSPSAIAASGVRRGRGGGKTVGQERKGGLAWQWRNNNHPD